VVPGDPGALVIQRQERRKEQGPALHLSMVDYLALNLYHQQRKLLAQLMVNGGLGDPGPPVFLRQGRRKEKGSVTIQHLLMVGRSVPEPQQRKYPVQD